jgi:hypothetical protein
MTESVGEFKSTACVPVSAIAEESKGASAQAVERLFGAWVQSDGDESSLVLSFVGLGRQADGRTSGISSAAVIVKRQRTKMPGDSRGGEARGRFRC